MKRSKRITPEKLCVGMRHKASISWHSMAGASWILLILVEVLISTASALEGSLLPLDPIIEKGSDLVLNCTLNASSNNGRTTQDVIWKHNSKHDSVELSPDLYTSLSDTVSQLPLTNVTFDDWGLYFCLFPGDNIFQRLASEVSVGKKPAPPTLNCTIPSPDSYRCSWGNSTDTQIQTRHKFMFKLGDTWAGCPFLGSNTCTLSLEYVVNLNQHVRVTSTNHLGEATTEKVFHIHRDVTVNQPRHVELTKMDTETSLRVRWSVPSEWLRSERDLMYKLRYKKEECVMTNHSCCCWFETQDIVRTKSFTLRDLDPYTKYSVQVAARYERSGEENWSKWSEVVTARTRETTPLETVQDLDVIETPNTEDSVYKRNVVVYWTSVEDEDQHGQLLGYKVVIQPDDVREVRQEHSTRQNVFRINDLQKFSGYLVQVAAQNTAGTGPWMSVRIQDLTRCTAPGVPDEVRAVALTTTSICVEWEEPSQANGYIENYIVEWGRNKDEMKAYNTSNSSQLSYIIHDLEVFTLYEVGVKIVNSCGEGEIKSVGGGARTLEGVPDAPPTRVEVKPVTNHPDKLLLSWQRPPAENINGILLGYAVTLCISSLDSQKTKNCSDGLMQRYLSRPDAVNGTLTDLDPSTTYLVWIAAYTAVGSGPDSEPVEGKTEATSDILLKSAIAIPTVVLLCACIFGLLVWYSHHISVEPLPDPSRNKPCESRENTQTVQGVSSPAIAVISGTSVVQERSKVSKAAMQSACSLELMLDSVHLDPKMVKMNRSESGDSGIPSSPENDPLDLNALGAKESPITEEDGDSVFLEDRDGGLSAAPR